MRNEEIIDDAIKQSLSGFVNRRRMELRASKETVPSSILIPLKDLLTQVESRLQGLRGHPTHPLYIATPTRQELAERWLPSLGLTVHEDHVELEFTLQRRRLDT